MVDITHTLWKKRRAIIGSQLPYQRSPHAKALADAGKAGPEGIVQYIADELNEAERFRQVVMAATNKQAAALELCAGKDPGEPGEQSKRFEGREQREEKSIINPQILEVLRKLVDGVGEKILIPTLKIIENRDPDETIAERAYRPDLMEKDLKLLAMLDSALDKHIARYCRL